MDDVDRQVRALYEGQLPWSARAGVLAQKRRAVFTRLESDPEAQVALYQLLPLLESDRLEPVLPTLGPQPGNTVLDALSFLAQAHTHWLRSPDTWQPEGAEPRQQLAALSRHLLVRYPLPVFFDSAWLEGDTDDGRAHRQWFIALGQGQSLHALDLPTLMTHRARHYFLDASLDLSLIGALRYGQVRALGGDELLVRALVETPLGGLLPDEALWHSVLAFFVRHRRALPTHQLGPIVDYIVAVQDTGFTMKGRTPEALLARVTEWHERLGKDARQPRTQWEPTGLSGLTLTEREAASGATLTWSVVEMNDSIALLEEGREQRHCVTTYRAKCLRGESSLWSVRVKASDAKVLRRYLTVEVNNARRAVIQVRGKCNQTVSAGRHHPRMRRAEEVLRQWVHANRLGIACSL